MTVTLEALDYSRPVQALFAQATRAGKVHSVFPKALNIAVDDTLFALLSSEMSRMPDGVRVPASVMGELYERLNRGMEIRVGDGQLFIPALDFTIHLPDRASWEPIPAIERSSFCYAGVVQHAGMLALHLARHTKRDGLGPLVKPLLLQQATEETPLARIALPLLRLLVRACQEDDRVGVIKATQGLAGLGPGLTPSGDDTLGGFVAVLALLPSLPHTRQNSDWMIHSEEGEFLASIIAGAARPRTGLLSGVLLTHAARGEMAEHIGELLASLALPVEATDVVLQAADRVLAYGACSGSDTLLGVLLGLQALGIDYFARARTEPPPVPCDEQSESITL